jgi:hypothetical protein
MARCLNRVSMAACQNVVAAQFALPEKPMPVRDRSITLRLACSDYASYSSSFLGLGSGKGRVGGTTQTFVLCENHAQLFSQIDDELVQEGWAHMFSEKPTRI